MNFEVAWVARCNVINNVELHLCLLKRIWQFENENWIYDMICNCVRWLKIARVDKMNKNVRIEWRVENGFL